MTDKRSTLTRYLMKALLCAGLACAVIMIASAVWARANTHAYVVTYRLVPADGDVTEQMLGLAARIVQARVRVLGRRSGLKDCRVRTAEPDSIVIEFQTRFDPAATLRWVTMTGQAEFCLLHPDPDIMRALGPEEPPQGYHVKVFNELRYSLSRPGSMTQYTHEYLICREPLMRVERFADVHFATVGLAKETVLTFELDEHQSKQFAALTALNVGREMALLIDGELFFPPKRIPSAISGGTVQIRGYFDNNPLRKLVRMLNAGTVPGRLEQPSIEVQ